MENLMSLLGLLFMMFLVISASVEVVLEVFRGTLERFGVTWAKGKVSLDDALKLASEFAPNNQELNTKLQAVKSTAKQVEKIAQDKLTTIENLEKQLKTTVSDEKIPQIAANINAVAAEVKNDLEASERLRIFVLRLIAAVLGCVLVYNADFYVFQILAEAPEAKDYLSKLSGLKAEWVNVLIGGLAAAAGSSYWHDKLDKVRKIKSVVGETKKLTK